jgi:hypothetical protein
MIRVILFIILLYFIVKVLRMIMNWQQQSGSMRKRANIDIDIPPSKPFESVQDAEFEDLTPKPPSPESSQPSKDR